MAKRKKQGAGKLEELKKRILNEWRIEKRLALLMLFFIIFVALGTAMIVLFLTWEGDNEPTPITSHLLEFYGRECPYCMSMFPVIKDVELESGIAISTLEVWHNKGNKAVMERFSDKITAACGGKMSVPSFYNNKTGEAICGVVSKDKLLQWALAD